MLSLLILRLPVWPRRLFKITPLVTILLYCTVYGAKTPATKEQWCGEAEANDRRFYSYQTHNPSELMTLLCVGLDSNRSHVNLQLWHMWPPVAGVIYTYIEYSLCTSVISAGGKEPKRPTVPLPFPNASGSQRTPAPALNRRQWNARSALRVQVNTTFGLRPLQGSIRCYITKVGFMVTQQGLSGGKEVHRAASHLSLSPCIQPL